MSWDCTIIDPKTGRSIHTSTPHTIRGGTYAYPDTTELWCNITYNYSQFYKKYLGAGLEYFNNMRVKDSISKLQEMADSLNTDESNNYWDKTEGNARKAIVDLLALAQLAPDDAIWEVV